MTQKRYTKLCRAYFTRLHEWDVNRGGEGLPLKKIYKSLHKPPQGITRDEWCLRMVDGFKRNNVGIRK